MSLFAGLTGEVKLGGIFGLSSYLLLADKFKEFIPKDFPNQSTPVFMGHGDMDAVVKFEYGQQTAEAFKGMGLQVDFRKYPYVPNPIQFNRRFAISLLTFFFQRVGALRRPAGDPRLGRFPREEHSSHREFMT